MAKKNQSLILSHAPRAKGAVPWLAVLVVGGCAASDWLTVFQFSTQLFNETEEVSFLISGVMACGLDVSLAVLGSILSGSRPKDKEALLRRRMAAIGLISAFALSFLALVLLAAAVSVRNESNMLTDGTLARLIAPLVTSLVSFFVTFCIDPRAQRRAELDRQIVETREAIDRIDVDTARLEQALSVFDGDTMDYTMSRASRLKIEILQQAACQAIHEELAKQIGDSEGVNRILALNQERAGRVAEMEKELQELLEQTDVAPHPKEESIRIVTQEEAPDEVRQAAK